MLPKNKLNVLSIISLITVPVISQLLDCTTTAKMLEMSSEDFKKYCRPTFCNCFTLKGCSPEWSGNLADGMAMLWYNVEDIVTIWCHEENKEVNSDTFGYIQIKTVNNKQYLLVHTRHDLDGLLRMNRESYLNLFVSNKEFLPKINTLGLFDIKLEPHYWNEDEMTDVFQDETSISLSIYDLDQSLSIIFDRILMGPMGGTEVTQTFGYFKLNKYADQNRSTNLSDYTSFNIALMGVTLTNDFYVKQNVVIPGTTNSMDYYICLGRKLNSATGLTYWTGEGCRPVPYFHDHPKNYLKYIINGDYSMTCECDFDSLGVKYPNNLNVSQPKVLNTTEQTTEETVPNSTETNYSELGSDSVSKNNERYKFVTDFTLMFASIIFVVIFITIVSDIGLVIYLKIYRK